MGRKWVVSAMLAVAWAFGPVDMSSAAWPDYWAYGGWGLGAGFPPGAYCRQRIPYYALYPPVYYTYPVGRSYGQSPFAYPPGMVVPEASSQASVSQPQPLRIVNPYVARVEEIPPPEPALPPKVGPRVVFPAQPH